MRISKSDSVIANTNPNKIKFEILRDYDGDTQGYKLGNWYLMKIYTWGNEYSWYVLNEPRTALLVSERSKLIDPANKSSDGQGYVNSCKDGKQILIDRYLIENTENSKEVKATNMRISKSNETSVKASEYKVFNTHGGDSELNKYSGQKVEVIRPLTSEEADLDDVGNMYKVRLPDGTVIDAFEDELEDSVDACGEVKASTSTDKALKHIKAAIDILGKSGNKDSVTKDSIANLATVMFDIKASTITAASKCKYSKKECIDAIQDQYGKNKKEAEEYYKSADAKTLEALVDGFKGNAKKTFYDD